jgi:ubiquinone/menaquinone biosynthesis C-methylase UbiE
MKRRPSGPTDASRRYHDRVARKYDAIYDDPYWEFHDRLTWNAIKPHLPRDINAACCDIGCGTGKWGLKILKSGYPTTFVDHAANMIEQVRAKLPAFGPREKKATLLTADMVDLSALSEGSFALILALGDPLSICADPVRGARELFRICSPGGVVIATVDNQLAGLDHYLANYSIAELEDFVHTGRTQWLTPDEKERFDLHTFTPHAARKLFEHAGFEVMEILGKTILPLRKYKHWLEDPDQMEKLLRLERQLSKDPSSAAVAGHLQIQGRKPQRATEPEIT